MGSATHRSPEALPGPTGRIARALRTFTSENDLYVAAAGRGAAMHPTDLIGLGVVLDRGRQGEATTPGQLSTVMHLSAPATSAMLDRLERLGHVRRKPHATDRRSVTVEVTEHARNVGTALFTPLGAHLAPVYARRTPEELGVIADFLDEVNTATRAARREVDQATPHRVAAPGE